MTEVDIQDSHKQIELQEHSKLNKSNNKRIAKNAIMLYIRMFLTMIVGLYTSRVVLATLGVEDYGIYGVVGGVVAMMGFLNASMSSATSRFLTFELGRGQNNRLKETFSSALIVHIGIALIVLIVAETAGLWFLCNKLVIPEGRMAAAHWVYQLSIASAMLSITQAPYNASIIAHEKMNVYAYVEILNVCLKLLIVYMLVIGDFDKLILYSILHFAVSVVILLIYRIYCIQKFDETHFHWIFKKEYIKPLISFSGWSIYGYMSFTFKQQGINFIFNMFYGVILNAACGLSNIIQGIISAFASNVILAFKPRIIKLFANNEISEMSNLVSLAIKSSIFLFALVVIPFCLKTDYILSLWLVDVPDGMVFITQWLIITTVLSTISNILYICLEATGDIKKISIINGTLLLMCIPMTYVILKIGFTYKECYYAYFIIALFYLLTLWFTIRQKIPTFKLFLLLKRTLLPLLLFLVVSSISSYFLAQCFDCRFFEVILFIFLSVVISITFFVIICLKKSEIKMTVRIIRDKIGIKNNNSQ